MKFIDFSIYLILGNKTYSFCEPTCPAVIDSSTSVISGPSKIIRKINSLMGATELLMGRYQVINIVIKNYLKLI